MNQANNHTSQPLPERIKGLYNEFPRQFWILVAGMFIDRLGGALLFPFFSLYLTRKFQIDMTQVGLIFGLFAISSFIGSMVGGALTDRWGRKSILLFGLSMSGLSSVLMGVIDVLPLFMVVTLVVGILSDVAGPAYQSLVADLLPEEKRAQGFGILRVVANLAVVIGPLVGGFLAAKSYLILFITDATTSVITAIILFFALQETHRPKETGQPQESMAATFKGYFTVVRDSAFVGFLIASVLMVVVYMQMNTTLSVYLRDYHGVPEQGFGYILSLNAIMVVLFQFSITRWINRYRPLIIMTVGSLLYAVGFAMYGFVSAFALFLVAMAIITVGEMFVSPVSQSIVARLAPEDMRGRYMAVYGFSWLIPFAIGPLLAGLVMDNLNPDWVWYIGGVLGLAAAGGYYWLELRAGHSRFSSIDARLAIMQNLEEGRITAEDANVKLESIKNNSWGKLASHEEINPQRNVRIRVSDQLNQVVKSDLVLPIGLVNTVLHAGGKLSVQLDRYDPQELNKLIAGTAQGQKPQQMIAGDDCIEVTVE
ncbi:MAG: MFS transporter [Chloroflexi bacterium]|nr:MAG: MFS transporter [Chloroflexota bacterium]